MLFFYNGGEDQSHRPALHRRWFLNGAQILFLGHFRHSAQRFPGKLRMGELSASEDHRHLDFVSLFKELESVAQFELEIMLVGTRTHTNAFNIGHSLLFLRLPLPLAKLILVFAVVPYAANRRIGGRRDLDNIESTLPSNIQRFTERNDSDLGAILVDQSDFARPNALINPEVLGYLYITSKEISRSHVSKQPPNRQDGNKYSENPISLSTLF